ncbi:transposase [Streptomyces sp. NPDC052127]|uniref:transposase n=1 Tax=Streptomyces sp. NPDC052127 TaxID=3155679 RepID=UPI0034460564
MLLLIEAFGDGVRDSASSQVAAVSAGDVGLFCQDVAEPGAGPSDANAWYGNLLQDPLELRTVTVVPWCQQEGELRMHLAEEIRRFIADHTDWLTVFQLQSYSPDLNPQEGIWSLVKRDIGNLAAADLGQITLAVKRRLKQIQYRPDVVDGCLTSTGLTMDD